MKPLASLLLMSAPLLAYSLLAEAQVGASRTQGALQVTSITNGHPVVTFVQRVGPQTRDFAGDVVRQWYFNYTSFSKALVEAAEQRHLDSVSLAAVLKKILSAPENYQVAFLPVSAESTKFRGEWAWAITLQCGGDTAVTTGTMTGHTWLIFSQETLNQLEFKRCM